MLTLRYIRDNSFPNWYKKNLLGLGLCVIFNEKSSFYNYGHLDDLIRLFIKKSKKFNMINTRDGKKVKHNEEPYHQEEKRKE